MTTRLSLLILFLSAFLSPLPGQTTQPSSDRAAKAKESAELRLGYAASDAYNPYDGEVREIREQCSELLASKDFAKAIELAERGLLKDRYNIQLLMLQASAYRAAGDVEKADKTRQKWIGLVDSIIINSGDGRSFATAFRVISVDEEYAVLAILHLEMVRQQLVEHNGSEFDLLEVKDARSGNEEEIYFNIDLPKKWLNKSPDQPSLPAPPAAPPPAMQEPRQP
jgi:hypothetical protein